MASITSGISSLLQSVMDIVSGIVNIVFGAFRNVFDLAQGLISSIFDLASGFIGFVLGEFDVPCPVTFSYGRCAVWEGICGWGETGRCRGGSYGGGGVCLCRKLICGEQATLLLSECWWLRLWGIRHTGRRAREGGSRRGRSGLRGS